MSFFSLISQTPYSNVMTPNPFEDRVSERALNKVRQSHTQKGLGEDFGSHPSLAAGRTM
jgi:hypothetical protein